MLKYDPLVFLDLLMYLTCLLSVILCLPLNFCASVLYFVAFICESLVALLVPLDLPLHVLVGRHLLGGLPPQLSQLRVPLPCNVIQPHVLVLQPRIVSLGSLYLRAELPQLLPQRVYLQSLFHYGLLQVVFITLLCGVKVVEAFLETPDLVLERGEVSFSLAVLLDLEHHVLQLTVIHD